MLSSVNKSGGSVQEFRWTRRIIHPRVRTRRAYLYQHPRLPKARRTYRTNLVRSTKSISTPVSFVHSRVACENLDTLHNMRVILSVLHLLITYPSVQNQKLSPLQLLTLHPTPQLDRLPFNPQRLMLYLLKSSPLLLRTLPHLLQPAGPTYP